MNNAVPPIAMLAANLKRERERAGLSLTDLAKRAGLAKSTLSQLESGVGNPSIETLWSLAVALGVQVSRLISETKPHIQVIRASEGAAALSERGNYAATLLAACPPGAQRDIYRLTVQPGEPHRAQAHGHGATEHLFIASGRARVGPEGQMVELDPGDYICYSADVPHLFEALEKDTVAILLFESA